VGLLQRRHSQRLAWVVDAQREGRCYIVEADELLSAFLELKAMLL
jgi:hypothetical protein